MAGRIRRELVRSGIVSVVHPKGWSVRNCEVAHDPRQRSFDHRNLRSARGLPGPRPLAVGPYSPSPSRRGINHRSPGTSQPPPLTLLAQPGAVVVDDFAIARLAPGHDVILPWRTAPPQAFHLAHSVRHPSGTRPLSRITWRTSVAHQPSESSTKESRMEYKVVTQKDRMFGGKFNP